MGSRNYCFTVFDLPFAEDFESTIAACGHCDIWGDDAIDTIKYCVWQLEESPTSGRWHLQGYMELTSVQRISAIKKWGAIWETTHLEARKGTREEADIYCRKDESRIAGPWSIGSFEAGGQGKRNELVALVEAARGGAGARQLAIDFPSTYIRYGNGVHRWLDQIRENPVIDLQLCRWEHELWEELQGEPHPRKIIWYVDDLGGSGKSTFIRWVLGSNVQGGAQLLAGGQHQRILYAVEPVRIHFFDFARGMGLGDDAHFPYVPIEQIKNGLVPAGGMYGAGSRVLGPNHCVCFSNTMPDLSKFSNDRWDIRLLKGPEELQEI